jgi:hypothetical protein
MSEKHAIDVFQDLALRGPAIARDKLRSALLEHAQSPWAHAEDNEKRFAARTSLEGDVIAFRREADAQLPAAELTLWSRDDGYEVTNIVPAKTGQLRYANYNALLQEFVERIAKPAADAAGFSVDMSSPRRSLEDMLSPEASKALRQFSSAANKSTGSSHPADRKRWLQFIILAHTAGGDLGADVLARWLIEIDGWDDDSAHNLAIQYEFAQELLDHYDVEQP